MPAAGKKIHPAQAATIVSGQTYTGINIQWPISQEIISGKKVVETRTYPIPNHYLNEPQLGLLKAPNGGFKPFGRGLMPWRPL